MESPRSDTAEFEQPTRTVVIKRHQATDSTQLELQLNDIVMVLEKDATGWWGGHKEGEELTGWFPGFCVQPCPLPEPEKEQPESFRNSALETEASSPVRRNHAVASPQRHGIPPSYSAPAETSSVLNSSQQDLLLQEKSQLCLQLDSEVTKLKRDKETLEEALRQAQRKTSLDKEEFKRMEDRLVEAERKLQTEASQRRATLMKCEQLEETVRHRDEEVATLRRLSASPMTMTPQMAAIPSQSPPQEANEEGMRRRLFQSIPNGTNMINATELSSTNLARSPSPKPVASSSDFRSGLTGGCNASVREISCGPRRSEEEPPVGYVKQLRNAFEARSATPQRADSRARGRPETAVRPLVVNTTMPATTATIKGGSQCARVLRPEGQGISAGPTISTDASAEEIVYGMSPINSQNKKDLKKTFSRTAM